MTTRALALRLLFLLLPPALCAALPGCGYTMGDASHSNASLYRGDVQTVAVPIFTNRSVRRGVEFNLTKAVVNALEARSPYRVTERESADTILEGEIIAVDVDTISSAARGAIPQEQLYTVAVNFTWKDLRTGKILVERRRYEQTATYYPTLGDGQFVGAQQNVERLAQGIVQELQADW